MQQKKQKKIPTLLILIILAIALGIFAGFFFALHVLQPDNGVPSPSSAGPSGSPAASGSAVTGSSASIPNGQTPDDLLADIVPNSYSAIPLPAEMRAMWFSFLEWKQTDFSTEASARAALATMFDHCAEAGLNTVIVAVRPFNDALYPSELFPWSHVLWGSDGPQGQNPGYDPLALMIELAHARGLRIEAWLNPYRVQHPTNGPATLHTENPAAENPAWVRTVGSELWLDPGMPEVEQLVVAGVLEIVQLYDVDGIHFDDYFYPSGATESFDATTYAAHGGGASLADWRRQNTSRMLQQVYAAVKAANPGASFGVSVQGNNGNNYNQMYADVQQWLANPGYTDYVMPQIYWGFAYQNSKGETDAAFASKTAEWAGYTRDPAVRLYAGLGMYRIGSYVPGQADRKDFGDGGAGSQDEWATGHSMADQVTHLRGQTGFSGFALFRYAFAFQPEDSLSASEMQALAQLLQ